MNVISIAMKVWAWVQVNGASLIAVLQCLIKAIKELLTAILNLVSIILSKDIHSNIVDKVRAVLNSIDGWLEQGKKYLIKK